MPQTLTTAKTIANAKFPAFKIIRVCRRHTQSVNAAYMPEDEALWQPAHPDQVVSEIVNLKINVFLHSSPLTLSLKVLST